MTQEDEEFLQRLLATFKLEAQEHLSAMSGLLLQLERVEAPSKAAAVESLFREAHSLKGAARSVNLADVERVCQALERVMAAWKRGELSPTPALYDSLHAAIDGLARMLAQRLQGEGRADAGLPVQLSRSLLDLLAGPAAPPAEPARPEPEPMAAPAAWSPAPDTVRISTAKLEALLTQAEELQALKFSSAHLADELAAASDTLTAWRRQWSKRLRHARALRRADVSGNGMGHASRERRLAQALEHIDADEVGLKALNDRLARLQGLAARDRRQLSGRVDRLLDDVKQVLMLPMATLLAPLPKLVRDLAHDSGKEVDLHLRGGTLDVDRRILEQMKAPLTHLLRNAVDHGIETPQERRRAGKPGRGRISIDVTPRGNRVEIVLTDDGAGLSLDRVRSKALAMGLLSAQSLEAMSPAQQADLVFESGLSTSALLTDLSGHGLGLAIVREKVEALGGSISLESTADGIGTRFCIVLPTTLATFRGLLVRAGDRSFVLPSRSVERVARVPLSAVRRVGEGDAITLDGDTLSLVSLVAVLGLPAGRRDPAVRFQQVVLLASGDKRIAFAVDEVLGDEEVLVKPLALPLKRVRHIAGATVLGAGRVVPLLNVLDLMKSAQMPTAAAGAPVPASGAPAASLLVAEDSITSRALLKGMLEAAGFRVTTAADGIEALEQLHQQDFDLLVTDVEMPRLDGFGLTERLRSDKRLADLPVILVTALDTREDKERGVEVGANAYIVKRGFDQSKLLATIRTLL
ncbi:two-component system, chemotaxis family, sensor kinase CheA [Burkholderiaceae bacterium]|nr:two-component system, chemotaxis family, sensor kinase CheA [Burkholderiaceae bacterium]